MNYELSLIDNKAYELHNFLSVTPPIKLENMENVVRELGGKLEYAQLIEDAHILKNDNSFTITVNKSHNAFRNNFSIAREIGHLMLHMEYNANQKKFAEKIEFKDNQVYYRYGNSKEEYEANEFAGLF